MKNKRKWIQISMRSLLFFVITGIICGFVIKMYKLAEGLKEYKDEIDTVLEILLLLYRDTLVYIKTGSRRYIIQQDKIDDIINMAQTSNTAQLEKRCDAINDTRMKLLNNGDFQLMTETLFFKIKEK